MSELLSLLLILLSYAQRLTPITATCVTNIQEITSLCKRLLEPFIADEKSFTVSVDSLLGLSNLLNDTR